MNGYHQFCGLAVALDRVGDRWNLLIVRELLIAPRRFAQLRAALPGMASNLLVERLRDLEAAGLVARETEHDRKAVVYSLTPLGRGLDEAVRCLVRWGAQFMAAGPSAGDAVRADWVGLAAQALLEPGGAVAQVDAVPVGDDGVEVTVTAHDGGSALLQGPPAAVLGVVAGVLDPAAAAGRVRVDDPRRVLAGRTGRPHGRGV